MYNFEIIGETIDPIITEIPGGQYNQICLGIGNNKDGNMIFTFDTNEIDFEIPSYVFTKKAWKKLKTKL